MAIDTLENVAAALGITGSPIPDADQISALLEPVTAAIEAYVGRSFTSASFTEDHQGGDEILALREFPVTSITSIEDLFTGETLASTLYEVEARTGLLTKLPRGSKWATARRNQVLPLKSTSSFQRWRVTYVAGAVPEAVKLAFYEAISAKLGGAGGYTMEQDGDYMYQRSQSDTGGLPNSSISLLQTYRSSVFI